MTVKNRGGVLLREKAARLAEKVQNTLERNGCRNNALIRVLRNQRTGKIEVEIFDMLRCFHYFGTWGSKTIAILYKDSYEKERFSNVVTGEMEKCEILFYRILLRKFYNGKRIKSD